MSKDQLRIGEIARRSGLNVDTLRYYERRKLITPPARSASGYRFYSLTTIDQLRFIRRAKTLGFSLNEIQQLLSMAEREGLTCEQVAGFIQEKIHVLDERIGSLQTARTELSTLLSTCAGGKEVTDCGILSALKSE